MKNLYKWCTENEEGAFLTPKNPLLSVLFSSALTNKTNLETKSEFKWHPILTVSFHCTKLK